MSERTPADDLHPMQCQICGRPHARCRAHTRAGDPCGNFPMTEQRICRMHGGKAPQAVKAAERRGVVRAVEADAQAVLAYEGLAGIDNPLEELSRLARESMAFKDALAARMNALSKLRGAPGVAGTEQLKVEVGLYERSLDRTGKFLDLLVRSGFEERRITIAKKQGEQLAVVVQRVLGAMLTAMQEALDGDELGRDRLIEAWPRAVGEIVPGEFRRMGEEQS